jgi:hypothetical protein
MMMAWLFGSTGIAAGTLPDLPGLILNQKLPNGQWLRLLRAAAIG